MEGREILNYYNFYFHYSTYDLDFNYWNTSHTENLKPYAKSQVMHWITSCTQNAIETVPGQIWIKSHKLKPKSLIEQQVLHWIISKQGSPCDLCLVANRKISFPHTPISWSKKDQQIPWLLQSSTKTFCSPSEWLGSRWRHLYYDGTLGVH